MFSYRLAQIEDAQSLAPRLSPSDVVDCSARGLSPHDALSWPCRAHPEYTWAGLSFGKVEAMAGLQPIDDETAMPWLLTSSTEIEDWRAMLRVIRMGLETASFRTYYNYVPAENRQALRLIKHLGFQVGWPTTFGDVDYMTFVRSDARRKRASPLGDAALTDSDRPPQG